MFYAIEFLSLSMAKLIVLDRMADFVSLQAGDLKMHRLVGRIVVAAVAVGNLVGLAGNVAAAVYFEQVAVSIDGASAAIEANNTAIALQIETEGWNQNRLAVSILSAQAFCEVSVLLLIVVSFAVVGIVCVRRLNALLPGLDADGPAVADWWQLRRQIFGTTGFVFVTFLLRSVYAALIAVALGFQDVRSNTIATECPGNTEGLCNASCFNVFTHIQTWMNRTPGTAPPKPTPPKPSFATAARSHFGSAEFQLMVVLISKPLPLLVALWGMTSKRLLNRMQPNGQEMAPFHERLLKKLSSLRRA